MFDSSKFTFGMIRRAGRGAVLLVALGVVCSLTACDSSPKTAEADIPPAKAPAKADADPTLDEAEQFAARVAGSPSRPANGEVQWTTPIHASPAPSRETASANPQIKTVSIETPTAKPDPEPVKAAPKPEKLSPQQIIERLSADLKQAAAANDSLRPYLAQTALSLFDPQRELTEANLKSLKPEDRRLVLAYQRAFTMLGRTLGHSVDEDRQSLQIAAAELADQLDAKTNTLRLKNVTLCTRVNGYGVYEPFTSTTFLAGVEHPAIIYAELENFAPEIGSDGQYTVRLTQQVVLYNQSDGLAIWRIRPTEIVDRSRNRRRDFFVVQLINLPARLGVGKYNLKITLTDQVGQTVDEAELPIQIVADEKLLNQ